MKWLLESYTYLNKQRLNLRSSRSSRKTMESVLRKVKRVYGGKWDAVKWLSRLQEVDVGWQVYEVGDDIERMFTDFQLSSLDQHSFLSALCLPSVTLQRYILTGLWLQPTSSALLLDAGYSYECLYGAWCVCSSVCYDREPSKNGWTDQDAFLRGVGR